MLLGLEQPDAGEILGMEGRRKSAVFQEDRLCENASAVSNIRLVNPALSKGEAEAMLRELGLGDSLGQPVRTLSGGMKRRVAILRALAAEYDVLFCDEPFKGLDQATKAQVLDYFLARTQAKPCWWSPTTPEEANPWAGTHCSCKKFLSCCIMIVSLVRGRGPGPAGARPFSRLYRKESHPCCQNSRCTSSRSAAG